MDMIDALEAATGLDGLLDRVERGETVTIMLDGKPAARLVPVENHEADQVAAATSRGRQDVP